MGMNNVGADIGAESVKPDIPNGLCYRSGRWPSHERALAQVLNSQTTQLHLTSAALDGSLSVPRAL